MTVPPAILLFKGRGIISTLIRWQTRGAYSHAAIRMRDGRIVESWQGAGVRVKELKDWSGVDAYLVPSMTDEQWDWAIEYALAQVGKGYDYWAVIRFISRSKMPDNDKLFCSELVFEAVKKGGVFLFERIAGYAVAPSLLAISSLVWPESVPRVQPVPQE